MNRISAVFLLLCVLCYCTSLLAYEYQDCGSEVGKFSEVIISGCDLSEEKCFITRGSEISTSIKFTPSKDIPHMEIRLFGVLFDVPIPFPLKNADVCEDSNSGIKCPVLKDQEVVYKISMPVEKQIPSLSLEIIWEFVNDENEKIACIKFPVKIV